MLRRARYGDEHRVNAPPLVFTGGDGGGGDSDGEDGNDGGGVYSIICFFPELTLK